MKRPGDNYVPTDEELQITDTYWRAMNALVDTGGMRTILNIFRRMNGLQRINYCYHIEKLAYDDVPWAQQLMAKATLIRLKS